MSDRIENDKLAEALAAIREGRLLPKGVFFHADRTPTQADWDALDPNSFDTTCQGCGEYYEGTFGPAPDHAMTPCPHCGANKPGATGSPAGASSLAMWSDF